MLSGAEFKLKEKIEYYCPECRKSVAQPLVCKDCLAVLCRDCGSVLERSDELGIG